MEKEFAASLTTSGDLGYTRKTYEQFGTLAETLAYARLIVSGNPSAVAWVESDGMTILVTDGHVCRRNKFGMQEEAYMIKKLANKIAGETEKDEQ